MQPVDEEEQPKKSPIWFIIGPALAFLIVLMIVPFSGIPLDPEPKNIPSLDQVLPASIHTVNITAARQSTTDLGLLDFSDDQAIKLVADRVASESCPQGAICQAKALFYFVRDSIRYVPDPAREYIKAPQETLISRAGDCDDMAVLLVNLERAIGQEARYASAPQHLYLEVLIKERWVPLDPTCKECDFGEKPSSLPR
ncbi:MAG: transglutaminase-like domain-containing protein [Nanoarchaeota archaeon]